MLHTTPTKQCVQCGKHKPATAEYFPPRLKDSVDGLRNSCRECRDAYNKAYHEKHNEKHKGQSAERYRANKDKVSAQAKRYRAENRDRIAEQKREYDKANKDKARARSRKHYRRHRDEALDYQREYRRKNPDKVVLHTERRRARKVSKPDTFTLAQWQHCLDCFKGCCAVCERPLSGLFHRPHADHWIALSDPDSPGTVAKNMICLCGGSDGCNQSKGGKHPDTWLKERFGDRKAKQIAKKIQAYFDSLA